MKSWIIENWPALLVIGLFTALVVGLNIRTSIRARKG
jgi:hypothetical protein